MENRKKNYIYEIKISVESVRFSESANCIWNNMNYHYFQLLLWRNNGVVKIIACATDFVDAVSGLSLHKD